MKRIRIGKDISMRWEITTDGVAIPLEGRDLTVEIKSPIGIVSNIPYRVDGNSLIMTYYGAEQKRVGEYSITLWENKGKTGQNVVDVIRAFELVRTSQEEDDFVGGELQIESVDLGTENFDILTEGGYRAINIDTLHAEELEDSVNIKGKTYSNESFTITLPKANLDSAGVMSASDVRTLKEHADSIAQIKTSCEENAADIERVSNVVDAHEGRLGGIDTEVSALQSKVDENTTSISQINSKLDEHTGSISQINNTITDHGNSISQLESTTREHSNAISQTNSKLDEHTGSISQINTELNNKDNEIAQINTKLDEHTESINAKITTDRIEDGAVTSEKIATSAFDSTLSVSGKIAPADVVGEKITELQTEINGKQEALTLTVKDNGNIVLANIQGQSKEFMPATPSGDPMHYAYVAAGAEYNDTGADIVKTTPWADLLDDDYDGDYGKTVVHKAGHWYLNGLGDIANDEIRKIYQASANFPPGGDWISYFGYADYRTNFKGVRLLTGYVHLNATGILDGSLTFIVLNLDCLRGAYIKRVTSFVSARHVLGSRIMFDSATHIPNSENLVTIPILFLKYNISLSTSSKLSVKSVLYMINNEVATEPITITLHADAYARAMANADIVAALDAHSNVSLASA